MHVEDAEYKRKWLNTDEHESECLSVEAGEALRIIDKTQLLADETLTM